jgi:hypothetical protein
MCEVDLTNTKLVKLCDRAFYRCERLRSIAFPTSLREVGAGCFDGSGLNRLDFSHTELAELGAYAFRDCSYLSQVSFPKSVVRLGECCFQKTALSGLRLGHCRGLAIDAMAFDGCKFWDVEGPRFGCCLGDGVFGSCRRIRRLSMGAPLQCGRGVLPIDFPLRTIVFWGAERRTLPSPVPVEPDRGLMG